MTLFPRKHPGGPSLAEELSTKLFEQDAAVPLSWIADDGSTRWHRPGLISAWVDDEGRWDLEQRLGAPMDGALLNWWTATAEYEQEDAALSSLAGQACRLLDPDAVAVLRMQLSPLLDLGRDRSPRLTDWVARHVLVVPVPVVGADLAALSLAVRPPHPALFRVGGDLTTVQQRLLELRQERRDRAAARLERIRAATHEGRTRAAARVSAAGKLLEPVSERTPADTGVWA